MNNLFKKPEWRVIEYYSKIKHKDIIKYKCSNCSSLFMNCYEKCPCCKKVMRNKINMRIIFLN